MKAWLQPTLRRRLLVAVVLALAVIWLVLVVFQYALENDQDKIRAGIGSFMRYEMVAFEETPTEPEAYNFTVSLEREFNRSRRGDGRPDALMELTDRTGHRPLWMTEQPLPGQPGKVVPWHWEGRDYLVFRGDTKLWTFQVAYPLGTFSEALMGPGSVVGVRLLIAFPLLLFPIWLAISRGLRPLQRLSDLVAARHADDLSPLAFDARYGELQPLAHALDGLLARLSQKIAREHAFIQDAAHELRTPMAVISAHVHVLAKAETDEEKQEAERYLDRAIARASHLAEQLLEIARLDAAPAHQASTVDLAALARQTLADAAPLAHVREIELMLDAPDTLLHALEVSPFKSILDNLVSNAIRYIDRGGKVVVALAQEMDALVLSVADNGPGISTAEQSLVFERFYRSQSQAVSGSGLGLAIVRQAATRLGGQVRLNPGLDGRGCGFVVTLPLR